MPKVIQLSSRVSTSDSGHLVPESILAPEFAGLPQGRKDAYGGRKNKILNDRLVCPNVMKIGYTEEIRDFIPN